MTTGAAASISSTVKPNVASTVGNALRVDPTFLPTVEALSHENIRLCYYCLKCTAGCPTAYAMDYGPAHILKLVQLGQKDKVLRSKAIWLCVGCETCWTRCPNGIAAGHVMDALRVLVLHRQFLTSIRLFGRVHELSMLALYKLLSGDLFTDLDLGARMFLRGKIPILPERIKDLAKIRQLFTQQPRGQR